MFFVIKFNRQLDSKQIRRESAEKRDFPSQIEGMFFSAQGLLLSTREEVVLRRKRLRNGTYAEMTNNEKEQNRKQRDK